MKNKILFVATIVIALLCGCGDEREMMELSGALQVDSEGESGAYEPASDIGDTIFVYICGEINNPGVYEMPVGSRVYELISRAGGLKTTADKGLLNQALPLSDGQQISIPARTIRRTSEENSRASEGSSGGSLININTADIQELQRINGIGASRATDIVEYREANGAFTSIEDIMKVSGIKEGLFSKIKDQITVQ